MENSVKTSLRLGIIGMSEGNGHPYSWSAIFNGYDRQAMNHCPFPVIPKYLAKQSFPKDCISNAKVTHVWTQDKSISIDIARSAKIERVVDHYEQMLGEVDAILLARDDAENHLSASVPFLNAGLPVYIDKPIATNGKTLDAIFQHEQYPGQIFSCSALRFAKEFQLSKNELAELGKIEYVDATIGKSWAKYGVHIIEPVLHLLGLNADNIRVTKTTFEDKHLVVARWPDVTVKFATLGNLNTPISIRLYGTQSMKELIFKDAFSAFKRALETFIEGFSTRQQMISYHELKAIVTLIERGMN